MEQSKKERKKLIAKISKASGVAQYALEAKMTNEQVIEAASNLEILGLLKAANNYNRYCQGQKTAEANKKLKEFVSLQNSEIVKAGQWLLNSLSKVGQERQKKLLEKDLVHKDDYNHAVIDLKDTVEEQKIGIKQQTNIASKTIQELEKINDSLRLQLSQIQDYIVNNYGHKTWSAITKYLQNSSQNNLEEIKLSQIQDYIVKNYGNGTWLEIESCIQKNLNEDKRHENY